MTCLSRKVSEMLLQAFINSLLDYCSSLFAAMPDNNLNRLQLVQNAAARLLTRTCVSDPITPVLRSLHWFPVKFLLDFKVAMRTYKVLNWTGPSSLQELLSTYVPSRSLRSESADLLVVPRYCLQSA